MRRSGSSLFIFATVLAVGQLVGCGAGSDEGADSSAYAQRELAACGIDDVKADKHAHLRACDPDETKKTTICHVPPGNPANAHTICIGNAAVEHHLKNHDDYLGACKVENPCPPPPPEMPPPPPETPAPPAPEVPPPPAGGMSGGSSGSGGSAGEWVPPPPT